MEVVADLHIHSKYARACSPLLELPAIAKACGEKGVGIVSTGDFTHPKWMEHLEENLEEIGKSGLYQLSSRPQEGSLAQSHIILSEAKNLVGQSNELDSFGASLRTGSSLRLRMTMSTPVRFIVGTEISCIYKHKEKVRRLHLLIYAPNLAVAKRFNQALLDYGANLHADGRPIIGITGKEIVKMCLDIDPRMMVIPAHAWTPWFAVFGSKSGYDSLEECFEELTPEIFAIETGLSSDPPMNRRLTNLDNITLVSNSDAHSLDNLGREANVFAFENEKDITYDEIRRILKTGDKKKFLYTIEFYPEEGMYHYDGHRDCKFSCTPAETKRNKGICPVCKKKVTVGVLYRVDELSDRSEDKIIQENFIPHKYIVPLREIISACLGVGKKSKAVEVEYRRLVPALGNEFEILLYKDIQDIEQAVNDKNIALGIQHMRAGKVKIVPGFDGQYGVVDPFPLSKPAGTKQPRLF
ncbi:MAG: DNA helicase UvrD [Candidatus Magasanikbacteria bacterium]|nr:DNA helicase UvrD [Candidatus Magasanikbacteria bacterium]